MKLKKLKTKSTLSLEGSIDVYHAQELKDILLDALKAAKPLTVDGSSAERIDTVCCQLLISAKKSFEEQGVDCQISTVSDAMRNNIHTLGLGKYLLEEGANG